MAARPLPMTAPASTRASASPWISPRLPASASTPCSPTWPRRRCMLETARLGAALEAAPAVSPLGPDDFVPFVKAVGRGEKLRRDLTYDEAVAAVQMIVRRQATPAQIGGLLIAQRVKGEVADEIRGFTDGVRTGFLRPLAPRVSDLLDLGVPYDGK